MRERWRGLGRAAAPHGRTSRGMGARPARPALQPREARRVGGGGGVRQGSRRAARGGDARQAPDGGIRECRVPGQGAGLA